jgi:hypothetical protein
VPSLGPGALAALGALLLLVGASLARARRRSR